MSTGIYTTTDPDTRIKVVFDEEYPTENPAFPYAPGVLDTLIECYEEGNYYGVILQKRETWARFTATQTGLESVSVTLFEPIEERWVDEESIWACAGYENVAEEVAKEQWNVTVTGME